MRPTAPGEIDTIEPNDTAPAWARVWHVWTLILPRRSVEGGIAWGRVWRRHNGRKWLYKNFIQLDDNRIAPP
jgi:hypothetical protein